MVKSLNHLDDKHISVDPLQMLQLGLSVDGPIVTGSVVVANRRDVCEQLLRRVSNKIDGAQIDMNWLKRNFGRLDAESSEVQREQHVRMNILMIIGGLLMPNKLLNLVHLR
ncbi:hypothetical protein J1N35_022684 [Gossypium stocksii]|uniref:Uncharacterized protein n=1 Tax=Gossypium stocksii TaxID=47602 RepID=A0A9D3VH73_9ROSI|nr:hypothetical protein J1N35_022684 [Gossypium stocksii]